ncbi:MAG: TlpA family protein disulfide reductase [Candidatus Rokuibacteriota bacterium]
MLLRVLAALATLVVVLGPPSAPAMPRGPLPSFDLRAADGTRVSSVDLLGQQQWILLYATPGCRPCDDLLASLGRLRADGLIRRTVLVIGAPAGEARAYAHRALPNELRRLRWYADDQANAWRALQLAGAPMLVGIRDGRVEWGLSGAVNDAESLRALVSHWLGESLGDGLPTSPDAGRSR